MGRFRTITFLGIRFRLICNASMTSVKNSFSALKNVTN